MKRVPHRYYNMVPGKYTLQHLHLSQVHKQLNQPASTTFTPPIDLLDFSTAPTVQQPSVHSPTYPPPVELVTQTAPYTTPVLPTTPAQPTPPYSVATHKSFTPTPLGPPPPPSMLNQTTIPFLFQNTPDTQATSAAGQTVIVQQKFDDSRHKRATYYIVYLLENIVIFTTAHQHGFIL